MNYFKNQIDERRKADRRVLEESFQKIAGVVLGTDLAQKLCDESIVAKEAMDEILKFYHYKPVEIPASVTDAEDSMDYGLRSCGMMKRSVSLDGEWYRDAYGPMLGFLKETGAPVALLPKVFSGYSYRDPSSGKVIGINRKTAADIETEAFCFYRPLPLKKLGTPDLLIYMRQCISMSDVAVIILAALSVTAVGLLLPKITAALTGPVLSDGRINAFAGAAICLLSIALSSQMLTILRNLLSFRVERKISAGVEASMIMRLISLPVDFFRDYSPGELYSRSMSVNSLCQLMQDMIVNTGLTSLMSLLYIGQIAGFAPALALPSFVIILITTIISVVTAFVQMKISEKQMELAAKESGMSYSMITGVQKIKLSGAEKRVFARWLSLYADGADLVYNPPMFLKISGVITTGISLFSTIILYYLAVQSGIGQSAYFGFTAAYGSVMGAFTALSDIAKAAAEIRPVLEMAEPFLKTEPEVSQTKEIVTGISGRVELDHVSFRYSDDTPYILNNLSLKINPGEYVAIVGKTGCGKSTLIRLLLGFETPEKGAVYYDHRDIKTLDPGSLRRNIGTVTQDGGLFQGDIYSNIVITAPQLTQEDAWEAAETAGIAEDIRRMPMGMYTMISEGQGGISGGQKQRLMIARAVASKPKLLIFDEATSALDNKTQKQVSLALDKMGCTRIVVAHRLSTIRHCDRIVVLDGGEIIEDGTYEELIEKGGFFAELVERQRLDSAG